MKGTVEDFLALSIMIQTLFKKKKKKVHNTCFFYVFKPNNAEFEHFFFNFKGSKSSGGIKLEGDMMATQTTETHLKIKRSGPLIKQ